MHVPKLSNKAPKFCGIEVGIRVHFIFYTLKVVCFICIYPIPNSSYHPLPSQVKGNFLVISIFFLVALPHPDLKLIAFHFWMSILGVKEDPSKTLQQLRYL
eukprot:c18071_g1_i1 orf=20-322(-)